MRQSVAWLIGYFVMMAPIIVWMQDSFIGALFHSIVGVFIAIIIDFHDWKDERYF